MDVENIKVRGTLWNCGRLRIILIIGP